MEMVWNNYLGFGINVNDVVILMLALVPAGGVLCPFISLNSVYPLDGELCRPALSAIETI